MLDTGVIGVVPWSSINKPNVCSTLATKIHHAYNSEKFPISVDKNVTSAHQAQVRGGAIDGLTGTVGGPAKT